jgi:transcription antitermination factor NusG
MLRAASTGVYLLCELVLDERVQGSFREISGVSDFVRSGSTPSPLSPTEAERFVAGQPEEQVNLILPDFNPGDRIRVLRGAFAQMEGDVAEVRPTLARFVCVWKSSAGRCCSTWWRPRSCNSPGVPDPDRLSFKVINPKFLLK